MTPPAPVFCSTTTGWPRRSESFGASIRLTRSWPEPGGPPTRKRIGRAGKLCAQAGGVASATKAAAVRQARAAAERDIMRADSIPARRRMPQPVMGGPMPSSTNNSASRRRFMRFLAGSPLFATGAGSALAQTLLPKVKLPDPVTWAPLDMHQLIKSPKEAINVFDFEPVMRQNVPPAHFGYMASGIDDEVTLRANREDFLRFQLRPRRLVDVSKVDMSIEILGVKYASPIVIAPTGSNKAFHEDGELAVARAARAGNHLQILSTQATVSIEDATAARGAPIWFQLYATNKFEVARAFVTRAERAGCPAVAVTVDRNGGRNQETFIRLQRTDTRECGACHDRSSIAANNKRKPMY